ncbi:MAG: nitroreductase family protein [Acidimicrobiia bacterium]
MPSTSDQSVFEIMHDCRAMRRFTSEDVSDEIVVELLDAAILAPSGGDIRIILVSNQLDGDTLLEIAKGVTYDPVNDDLPTIP